ncbi:MAG: class I SAM-dependent methyltransferase, partial [Nitrosospira sp.]
MLPRVIRSLLDVWKPIQWCPVCGSKETAFLPLPEFYHENARHHGFVHFGKGEMTSHETYTCTTCGASDRERLYALWIDQQIEKNFFPKRARAIHIAPEVALSGKLKGLNLFDYKTADLLMGAVDYKVDMMNMPFDDESFDFFICSHVLEHVENDNQSIKELYRITKKGGSGI